MQCVCMYACTCMYVIYAHVHFKDNEALQVHHNNTSQNIKLRSDIAVVIHYTIMKCGTFSLVHT